jgi:hypothetical protein
MWHQAGRQCRGRQWDGVARPGVTTNAPRELTTRKGLHKSGSVVRARYRRNRTRDRYVITTAAHAIWRSGGLGPGAGQVTFRYSTQWIGAPGGRTGRSLTSPTCGRVPPERPTSDGHFVLGLAKARSNGIRHGFDAPTCTHRGMARLSAAALVGPASRRTPNRAHSCAAARFVNRCWGLPRPHRTAAGRRC